MANAGIWPCMSSGAVCRRLNLRWKWVRIEEQSRRLKEEIVQMRREGVTEGKEVEVGVGGGIWCADEKKKKVVGGDGNGSDVSGSGNSSDELWGPGQVVTSSDDGLGKGEKEEKEGVDIEEEKREGRWSKEGG